MPIQYKQHVGWLDEEKSEDGVVTVAAGYAFVCTAPALKAAGREICFSSYGWATRKAAEERRDQHAAEHEQGAKLARGEIKAKDVKVMQPLDQFIEERGRKVVQSEKES